MKTIQLVIGILILITIGYTFTGCNKKKRLPENTEYQKTDYIYTHSYENKKLIIRARHNLIQNIGKNADVIFVDKRGFDKNELVWYLECGDYYSFFELEYGKKPDNCIEEIKAKPLIEGEQYRIIIHIENYLKRAIAYDTSDTYDFTVE